MPGASSWTYTCAELENASCYVFLILRTISRAIPRAGSDRGIADHKTGKPMQWAYGDGSN